MSSENDTSINVCLLGNIKAEDLLGVGVQGHRSNFQSFMFSNLLGLYNTLLSVISSDTVQFQQYSGPARTVLSPS